MKKHILISALSLLFVSVSLYAHTAFLGERTELTTAFWAAGLLFSSNAGNLILLSLFIFSALLLFVAIRGIRGAINEVSVIRQDAASLLSGGHLPSEKKKRLLRFKRQGMGLRSKMVFFTIALVLIVNIMISTPLFIMMTESQKRTLLRSLLERSEVFMEGMVANARTYLTLGNIRELGLLPIQMRSISEAMYVTITGHNPDTYVFEDQVWATNDPNIQHKIDTTFFFPSISRITDAVSPHAFVLKAKLNAQARMRAGYLAVIIDNLHREANELIERNLQEPVPDFAQRLEQIQVLLQLHEVNMTFILSDISGGIWSEPYYEPENFIIPYNYRFVFFKPVMFHRISHDDFFWGLVRLEVSIRSILEEIETGRRELLILILLVALAAQVIGTIGALFFSTYLIRPVRQLVKHIEIIRDTENKAKLKGVEIKLKSRDELAILGNTINDMTQSIVKAAFAAGDLSVGKEVQKKFLPLNHDNMGDKLSSGFEETKNLSLFCYYEGAKGVSGDYFDYIDLDGRYYAIIKCDVAGKGIPAAFIMIQVATMFLNFFRRWKPTKKGMQIQDLVYQINEFIDTMAFRGRFAAFTLCLYDSETGLMRFCNAGDNIIHIFDASRGRVVTYNLPETPAAGVLTNFDVESKGGYKVQTMTLDHGDILLLYTDGIEESKRKFRNAEFKEILCSYGPLDSTHENHVSGQGVEELGNDRIKKIINAVMNKQMYTLRKFHNPEGDNKGLQFDFRSCKGTPEEVIMALISIEQMFRCYKDPNAAEENQVLIDKIVDSFLKEYFLQYRYYCCISQESLGNNEYLYYTHLMEDEQYDDLTILGIKRK